MFLHEVNNLMLLQRTSIACMLRLRFVQLETCLYSLSLSLSLTHTHTHTHTHKVYSQTLNSTERETVNQLAIKARDSLENKKKGSQTSSKKHKKSGSSPGGTSR